jgi:hypothetical protein
LEKKKKANGTEEPDRREKFRRWGKTFLFKIEKVRIREALLWLCA